MPTFSIPMWLICGIKVASIAGLVAHAGFALGQDVTNCGSLENHYGPFDYRTANPQQKNLVENAHFTLGVESLTQTKSSYFADDIGYTLRVFPNHHRALISIQKLAEREKTDKPRYAQWSVPCYFDRALRFQPSDRIVRMLFASYLVKNVRLDEATQQLDTVIRLAVDDPFTNFNVGLIFLDMKNYDRALIQAHRSSELGFMRAEIKDGLLAVGRWVEPTPATDDKKP